MGDGKLTPQAVTSSYNSVVTQASTQQYELDSSRHYEGILLGYAHGQGPLLSVQQADQMSAHGEGSDAGRAPSEAPSHGSFSSQWQDPLALQMRLASLATLVRKALRSVQGEGVDDVVDLILGAWRAAGSPGKAGGVKDAEE